MALDDFEDRFANAVKQALDASRTPGGDEPVAPEEAQCPSPDLIASYYEHAVSRVERARLDEHFSQCSRCQGTIAALLRAAPIVDAASEAGGLAAAPARGAAGESPGVRGRGFAFKPVLRIAGVSVAAAAMISVAVVAGLHVYLSRLARESEMLAAVRAVPPHNSRNTHESPSATELAINEQHRPMVPAAAPQAPSVRTAPEKTAAAPGTAIESTSAASPAAVASPSAGAPAEAVLPSPAAAPPIAPSNAPQNAEAPAANAAQAAAALGALAATPVMAAPAASPPATPAAAASAVAAAIPSATTPASPGAVKQEQQEVAALATPPPPLEQIQKRAVAQAPAKSSGIAPGRRSRKSGSAGGAGAIASAPVAPPMAQRQEQLTEEKPEAEIAPEAEQARRDEHLKQPLDQTRPDEGAKPAAAPSVTTVFQSEQAVPVRQQIAATPPQSQGAAAGSIPAAAGIEASHATAPSAAPSGTAGETAMVTGAVSSSPIVAAVAPGIPVPPRSVLVSPADHSVYWSLQNSGRIYRTTDRKIWIPQVSGVQADLLAGTAPSDTVCWAVGRGGTIVLTTDGVHWEHVKSPTAADVVGITAAGKDVATIFTAGGVNYSTFDGGSNWQQGH